MLKLIVLVFAPATSKSKRAVSISLEEEKSEGDHSPEEVDEISKLILEGHNPHKTSAFSRSKSWSHDGSKNEENSF